MNQKSDNKPPIIVTHKQNDASVDNANYLRNKRWIINNILNIQRGIVQQQELLKAHRDELREAQFVLKKDIERMEKEMQKNK